MSYLDDAAVAKEVLAAMKERLTTPALVERCTRCGALDEPLPAFERERSVRMLWQFTALSSACFVSTGTLT